MKYYNYFPGCSADATAAGLGQSAQAIARPLDMELVELEDWNCCGSTPYGSLDELESILVAARNLALAEKTGLDLVTPCSSCFVTLFQANLRLKEHPSLMEKVNQSLAVAGLSFKGGVRVRHLVEVLLYDITPEVIADRVKRPLSRLNAAPYYGCQLVRPDYGFDDPESPRSLDQLVASTGAEAVPFPIKNRCCGGSLVISETDSALELMGQLLQNAADNGAQCLVTVCPLCQTNLDGCQGMVNRRFNTSFKLPVLFLSQLIGLALGISPASLGFDTNIVSTGGVLDYIHSEV